jgi:hypothetical protein
MSLSHLLIYYYLLTPYLYFLNQSIIISYLLNTLVISYLLFIYLFNIIIKLATVIYILLRMFLINNVLLNINLLGNYIKYPSISMYLIILTINKIYYLNNSYNLIWINIWTYIKYKDLYLFIYKRKPLSI